MIKEFHCEVDKEPPMDIGLIHKRILQVACSHVHIRNYEIRPCVEVIDERGKRIRHIILVEYEQAHG